MATVKKMTLASRFRKFPTPTFGACGGASKDCAVRREDLSPIDQLFFDHDWGCKLAADLEDEYQRDAAKKEADRILKHGLKSLTEEDYKKYPIFQFRRPFFCRAYAKAYVKACLEIF